LQRISALSLNWRGWKIVIATREVWKSKIMMPITTRPLALEDGEAGVGIFFDAVHNGTADVYSSEQRKA